MVPMRRVAAAIAIGALLGSTALPALAALSCASPSAPSHACCAKGGEGRGGALQQPPCCKVAVAVKDATREQVAPLTSSRSAVGIPVFAPVFNEPASSMVNARSPACIESPAAPPLGPPVRLRI
jgi:hypothetical protein